MTNSNSTFEMPAVRLPINGAFAVDLKHARHPDSYTSFLFSLYFNMLAVRAMCTHTTPLTM
jgi:hypothetical protein